MLFCKPVKNDVLYDQTLKGGQTLSLRLYQSKKDQNIISVWGVMINNRPKDPDTCVITALLDEQVVCVYMLHRIQPHELGQYFRAASNDCLLQFYPGPFEYISKEMLIEHFSCWYFSNGQAGTLYADPDIFDSKSCRLLERCRFFFVQNIMLPSKAASLYALTPARSQCGISDTATKR